MIKGRNLWLVGFMLGFFTHLATPAFARAVSFKDTGVAFWIFIIIGAIIVLLQLIPAIVLFFSFVGRMTDVSQRRGVQKK